MASVTSTFVQKLFSLSSKKSCQKNEVSYQSNKSENTVMELQKILIWDDPFLSCCCVLFVNIVFWLIVYLDLKFYGIIFITLLILTCEQLWIEHISKFINKNKSNSESLTSCSSKTSHQRLWRWEPAEEQLLIQRFPWTLTNIAFCSFVQSLEICDCADMNSVFKKGLNTLSDFYAKAKFLRQSQPGLFCILTCLGFLLIGVIGKYFSGLTSFYLLLMAVMTVPGALVRFLPPNVMKGLTDIFNCSRRDVISDSDDEVEPYLLDTNEEALELLKLAGDLPAHCKEDDEESNDLLLEHMSERTSDTAESVCSKFSLYPESVVMPSPENSMDFWESDVNFWDKTEADKTPSNDINFQSQHFDGDSSEEEFVKGLDLSEKTVKKSKSTAPQQINPVSPAENVNSSGKNDHAKQLHSKNTVGSDRESSSDTDSFELISEGEM